MKHILMCPLSAYGHMTPMFELAKRMSPPFKITILVPQYLLEDIRSRHLITESDELLYQPVQDGYVQNADHAVTAFVNLGGCLEAYTPKLRSYLETLLSENHKPVFHTLIVDNMLCEAVVPVFERNIPVYLFNTASANGMHLKMLHYNENCPDYTDDATGHPIWTSSKDGLQPLPASVKTSLSVMRRYFPHSKGMITNSVREIEEEALREIYEFDPASRDKVFMVGPLIPDSTDDVRDSNNQQVLEWLNVKERQSVVYVSFGSMTYPSPEQTLELGKALLLSGKSCIVSLRDDYHKYLPAEMRADMANVNSRCGVTSWAPQRLILDHPSTGLFISHCGWNSVLEALASGVPVIGWPMFGEQGINATILAEHDVGTTVAGTGMATKHVVSAQQIAKLIGEIADGEKYRAAAKRWSEVLKAAVRPGGSSARDLARLMQLA